MAGFDGFVVFVLRAGLGYGTEEVCPDYQFQKDAVFYVYPLFFFAKYAALKYSSAFNADALCISNCFRY